MQAAAHLAGDARVRDRRFPPGAFGNAIRTACAGRRQPVGRRRRARDARRLRHAREPAGDARARCSAELARRPRRARAALHRDRPLGRHARRSPTRSSAGARGRTRTAAPTTARPACTSRSAAASPAASTARRPISPACRRRQPGPRARLPQRLRDGARSLVGHRLARRARRALRAGAVRQGLT